MSAKSIMTSNVEYVTPDDTVEKVREIMKGFAISQVPVIDGNKVLGTVTEKDVVNAFIEHGENALSVKVVDIMSKAPPIIDEDEDIVEVARLLKEHPAVLVKSGEKIAGIISRADIVYWGLGI